MTPDPYWCFGTCGYQIRQAVATASQRAGSPTPIRVEILCGPPAILTEWWQEYGCPHGNAYWVRPTDDQIKEWEANRIP